MLERRGDLWVLAHQLNADAVCITTNGFCKKDGTAVLGRGCALEAVQRWPELPKIYGHMLKTLGLRVDVMLLRDQDYHLVAFPVKPVSVRANNMSTNVLRYKRVNYPTGTFVPGWAAMADPNLIVKSCLELMNHIDKNKWDITLLPRPGCGNGGLDWNEVKLLITPILDDRVIVVSK